MYFHVDESGHTGTNLFDEDQPILYYGVLSSKFNIDTQAEKELSVLRKRLGVQRLHASELGNGGLVKIVDGLIYIQKKYDLMFDIYSIAKADHALICFFDQVFDQGLNPAITWSGYWTPLRYVLLIKLASLFDEEILKLAWSSRIELNDAKANAGLVEVCKAIKGRVGDLPDERSRTLIYDALNWAQNNPSEIHYNAKRKKDLLSITPNLIGFQSVMHGIASRLNKHNKSASIITVDQQSQFNKGQKTFAEFCASVKDTPSTTLGPGMPEIDFKDMPTIPLSFKSGRESAGLEIVDVYLWLFKRILEEKEVAIEMYPFINEQMPKSMTDEISINALSSKWGEWFENLPEPTEDEMKKGMELKKIDEERRLKGMGK